MPFDVASLYRQSNELFGAIQRGSFAAAQAVGAFSESVAKVNTPGKTYQMRAGWYHRCWRNGGVIGGELGNRCDHAIFPEAGTGIWGPKHAPYQIVPRRKKYLSWIGNDGKRHFAKMVKCRGQKPQFLGYSALFGQRPPPVFGQAPTKNIQIIERELQRVTK